MSQSGYTSCACRDCMEIAISDDETVPALCWECEEAGCDADGESECCVEPEPEPSMEITHTVVDGVYRQRVSPERLREILKEHGENLERPSYFGSDDEWNVESEET